MIFEAVSFTHLISATVYLEFAAFILLQNRRAPLNRAAVAMLCSFAIWSLAFAVVHNPNTSWENAVMAGKFSSIGWIGFCGFYVLFFSEFAHKGGARRRRWWLYPLLFTPPIILVYIQWTDPIMVVRSKEWFGWSTGWNHSAWTYGFFSYYAACMAAGLTVLVRFLRVTRDRLKKKQGTITLVTAVITVLFGTINNVTFSIFDNHGFPPLADVGVLVFVVGTTYAIAKYRIFKLSPRVAADRIIETMRDMFFLIDTRGVIVSVNKIALDTLRCDETDIVGRHLTEIVAKQDADDGTVSRILNASPVKRVEIGFTTKGGRTVTARLSSSLLPAAADEPESGGIVCVASDISDYKISEADLRAEVREQTMQLSTANARLEREIEQHKQAEERLRSSETRWKILFEDAPDAYYINDLSGTFIDGNRKAEELIGCKRPDLVGKSFLSLKLLSTPDVAKAAKLLALNAVGRSTGPDVFTLRRKDGSQAFIEIHTHPIVLDGKKMVLGIARDIGERRKAEIALRESEEKYRSFVTNFQGIAFQEKLDGVPLFFHGSVETITGYREEDFLTQKPSWKEIIHPDDRTLPASHDGGSADSSRHREYRILRNDGQIRWIREQTKSVCDEQNAPLYVQGVFYDITDRMMLEEQLRQAQKMEAIGQLAGGVAHDFNNVLGAIAGYADMLGDKFGHIDAKIKRYSDMILQAAQRAANLTAQLLAFARRAKFSIIAINLHATIRDTVQLIEHSINKNITIKVRLEAEKPLVRGDHAQLQNALINLAVNARDAMPEGGEIVISTETVDVGDGDAASSTFKLNPGRYICLSVKDTGTGMDEATKARIFEPFFTTKAPGKGTGLGMASVYGTVKSHQGAIDVISGIGTGTTVKLYFPQAGDMREGSSPEMQRRHRGSGMLLVVDDEKPLRELYTELLPDMGYTVFCCADGTEALEYYRAHAGKIDLVILDLIMPAMGGLECFRKLRVFDPKAKVLVASGYAADGDIHGIMQEGAKGFLSKPFDRKELGEAVEKALGG